MIDILFVIMVLVGCFGVIYCASSDELPKTKTFFGLVGHLLMSGAMVIAMHVKYNEGYDAGVYDHASGVVQVDSVKTPVIVNGALND